MAFTFQEKPVATIKAKSYTAGNISYSINGVTTDVTTPDAAAEQINKLYSIGGFSVAAEGMIHTTTKEAVNNG